MTTRSARTRLFALTLAPTLLLVGCSRGPAPVAAADHEPPPPTNRIDVPAAVRQNLGIEFATVGRRKVAQTLRLPGHFELLPAARTEHRAPLGGRVQVAVQPLQPVVPGTLLYTLDAPEWRRLQRELAELQLERQNATARIAAMEPLLANHQAHEQSLREAAAALQERLLSLEATRQSIGGQAPELTAARVQLAQVRAQAAEAAEHHAETETRIGELRAGIVTGEQRFALALAAAATLVGATPAQLAAPVPGTEPPVAHWQQLATIEVRAVSTGIAVDLSLATGAWVEPGALVAAVTDLGQVRFRAACPQSDLPRLAPGLPAAVVPAGAHSAAPLQSVLQLGAEADPTQRTLDLFVAIEAPAAWARPGIAAFVEIETASTAAAELAIPRACVLPDGLQRVFFRRDPGNPDRVIRIDADLGLDDGRWVVVKSGLVDGDEVVLAGAYELMLASSGTAQKGGRFHADGTFHADDHK